MSVFDDVSFPQAIHQEQPTGATTVESILEACRYHSQSPAYIVDEDFIPPLLVPPETKVMLSNESTSDDSSVQMNE